MRKQDSQKKLTLFLATSNIHHPITFLSSSVFVFLQQYVMVSAASVITIGITIVHSFPALTPHSI
jgi:hypothetical protein